MFCFSYRPCSHAFLQQKFSKAMTAIKNEMKQGAHRAGEPGAGEYLDQAQKLVEKYVESTVPSGRAADRLRALNNSIQQLVIVQQADLAAAGTPVSILTQITADNPPKPNAPNHWPNPNLFAGNQCPSASPQSG